MDIALSVIFGLVLLVFEPGNGKINSYCKKAVAEETEESFSSRKNCWDHYHEYRDEIPELKQDE